MRIAICDDDQQSRDTIEQHIERCEGNYPKISFHVSVFSSGEELLASCRDGTDFDMLFLDIQMKGLDGIQTARVIRNTNKHAIIFFVTGFTQYISAALTLNAFQFIVKPVKKEIFDREFYRALKKHYFEHKKYVIELDSRTIVLDINDIVYMESSDHYIAVHTERNKYLKRGKLDDEEKALISYGFVRTHHKYLVNMAFIFEIAKDHIVLSNSRRAGLSTRKRSDVMSCFNNYLAGVSLCSD